MGDKFGFTASPTDARQLNVHAGRSILDAPAGKYGFIKANGDTLQFKNGRTIRLWGTNLVFNGAQQSHAGSDQLADNLAKLGYNCVRLHGLDAVASPSFGGMLATQGNFQTFDATAIDKLDYLISALKKRGIYVKLCTHNFNKWTSASGVTDTANLINNGKILPYIDPVVENHYKTLIQSLLTHVNPYTGTAYKDEPAIAVVELANEDGPLDGYLGGSFNGTYTGKLVQGYWGTLIAQKWHAWLTAKYGTTSALSAAWNPRSAGASMLTNGALSSSLTGWTWSVNSGAVGTGTFDAGKSAAKLSVTTLAATPQKYHATLSQVGTLPLIAGERYEVSFDIEGSVAGNVSCELVYNTAVNGKFGNFPDSGATTFFGTVPVTTTKTNLRVVFDCKETVVGGNIKFDFAVGKFLGDVWVSNVVFRTAALKALDVGETIESANIARIYLFTPFADYSKERQSDTVQFYYELERDFGLRMLDFARNTVGARQIMTVNNWSTGGNASTCAQAKAGDVMDAHIYWDHPTSSDILNFTMHNKSPVGDTGISMPHLLTYNAVKDKPLIYSEVDNTFPAKYEYEFFPMLVPYSMLHGVAGIFKFAYTHYDLSTLTTTQQRPYNFFNTSHNPMEKIMSIIYSIVFVKGYIKAAQTEVVLDYTEDYTIKNLRRFSATKDFNLYPPGGSDFATAFPATHKVRKRFGSTVTDPASVLPSEMSSLASQSVYTSDTGEILWDRTAAASAYLRVDAPKFQSLTGRIASRALSTSNMAINVDTDSTVSVLSLDDKPIQSSSEMLLTLLTEQQNTNQVKDQGTGNMTDWGTTPVMLTQIVGSITLSVDNPANCKVYVLDKNGRARSQVSATVGSGTITFKTNYFTPWYLITKD